MGRFINKFQKSNIHVSKDMKLCIVSTLEESNIVVTGAGANPKHKLRCQQAAVQGGRGRERRIAE